MLPGEVKALSYKTRLTHYQERMTLASTGWRRMGWFGGLYIPEEIIYAAGLLPERMEVSAGPALEGDRHLQTPICHYARAGLQRGLRGEWPVQGLVMGHTCDTIVKLFDVWQANVESRPSYMLDIPHVITPQAVVYWASALRNLGRWLGENFNLPVKESALARAIQEYNEGRRLLHKLYSLRQQDPPPLTGAEALAIVNAGFRTPRAAYNRILAELIAELHEKRDQPAHPRGPRLLVAGGPLITLDLIAILETQGAVVVADELATGYRSFCNLVSEDGDPWQALAERYLAAPNSPYFHDVGGLSRGALIQELCERYQVDGVILFTIQYCDPHLHELPLLERELRTAGIPALVLEWAPGGAEQMRNRAETFLDMLA